MEFKRLVAPSLTDLFVDELEQMILNGQLKIGEKLPTERELAEKMKVSLAVINAGIKELASRGFLKIAPRKGVFVADYIRNGNMCTLKEIFEHAGPELDRDLLNPIAEFRRSIELAATRCACMNRTDETLKILTDLVTLASKEEEIHNVPEIAFKFHHEVAIASGNIYYPMITQTFKPIYTMFYKVHVSNGIKSQAQAAKSLKDILSAIRMKDSQTAEQAINDAIDDWLKNSYRNK